MIELKSVTKKYKMGDEIINALDGVSLKVDKGEYVAIVGPSGSGKTTLANIVGGLDSPDSGEVVVDEMNLTQANDTLLSQYRNKKIGFVFQTFNLQPNYTALENVMAPLVFARMPLGQRKKRAEDCLEAVGLKNRIKHRPNQLSGGEQQRVAIARALANGPEIIIADEPTGNLDSQKGSEIVSILDSLNQKGKITLIIITHDQNIARQARRIINIKDGRIN